MHKEYNCEFGFDYIVAHHIINRPTDAGPFFFIQIGAFDGITGDPLFKYVEQYGWQGVLFEPQEVYFRILQKNYSNYPSVRAYQLAIAESNGRREMFSVSCSNGDVPSWAPQLASFNRDSLMHSQSVIKNLEEKIESFSVDCITFDEVLHLAGTKKIDLLQIDVEGYDLEILKQIKFSEFKPSIIHYEHAHLGAEDRDTAIVLLGENGYKLSVEKYDTTAYLVESK